MQKLIKNPLNLIKFLGKHDAIRVWFIELSKLTNFQFDTRLEFALLNYETESVERQRFIPVFPGNAAIFVLEWKAKIKYARVNLDWIKLNFIVSDNICI